jgi:hypothetical protein
MALARLAPGFAVAGIVQISALRNQQSSIAHSSCSLADARIASKRIRFSVAASRHLHLAP